MPSDLGDQHDVRAVAHQPREACVTQRVRRQREIGVARERANHQIQRPCRQPRALATDEQRSLRAAVELLATRGYPDVQGVASVGVQRDLAVGAALALAHDNTTLARRHRDVIDIERGALTDPQARIDQQHRDRAVTRRLAALDGAHEALQLLC